MADTRTDEIAPPKEVVKAQKDVADLEAQRADIYKQIEQASVLIHAWENFNLTLRGEFRPRAAHAEPKTRKATGPRASQGDPSGLQKQVLDVIERSMPEGAKGEAINTALGATDNEALKKKIAAAINRLRVNGRIYQDAPRKPWKLVRQEPAAPEPSEPEPSDEEEELATADETAA